MTPAEGIRVGLALALALGVGARALEGQAPPGGARAAAQAPSGRGPGAVPGVRLGVSVTPDTVTVGDPFVVQLRVQVPAGAAVTFPTAPDSGAVEALDPRRDSTTTSGDVQDALAVYRVAAWDVGTLAIPFGPIVVREAGGAERRVTPGALRVHVRSVLPADSGQRVPKPARLPVPDAGLWWLPLVLALLALLAVIGLVSWLIVRALRRRQATPVSGETAYAQAIASFDRLEAARLVPHGERGRHVALAVEVLRDYLAARLPEASLALTGRELLAALGAREEVPGERLEALLAFADLVKFAARPAAADEATRAGTEARAIVEEVERAVRAREAREAAAAATQAAAEMAERVRYEEEARRRARRADGGPARDDDAPSERAA